MVPAKPVKSKQVAGLWGRIRKNIPRKRHLRGGWLHRKLGDRIFAHELWHITRHGVAAGAATGLFWAMMPIPFQMIPATITAYWARFNIPTAMSVVWVTNPFTWPLILYWQYRLGNWILGGKPPAERINLLDSVSQVPGPLALGCLITGTLLGTIGYFGVYYLWRVFQIPQHANTQDHR
jgi:uncharacterized protein (DUF2062 family)